MDFEGFWIYFGEEIERFLSPEGHFDVKGALIEIMQTSDLPAGVREWVSEQREMYLALVDAEAWQSPQVKKEVFNA